MSKKSNIYNNEENIKKDDDDVKEIDKIKIIELYQNEIEKKNGLIKKKKIYIKCSKVEYSGDITYINYIDIINSLICLIEQYIIFLEYPSFTRIYEYENIINTFNIFYCNYQKNSNKIYIFSIKNEFTSIYLIQKGSIKLLEEKLPLRIKDLIEISPTKIITLDYYDNGFICFELKGKEYKKIKAFKTKGYSVRKSPYTDIFFIMNDKSINVFNCETLELVSVIHIRAKDICFLNNNRFITVDCYSDYSRLTLFNLKTFKVLNTFFPRTRYSCQLHTFGNKGNFIIAEESNVSRPLMFEIKNNKINYGREIEYFSLVFYSCLCLNNIIFIGGEKTILMYEF